MSGAGRGGGATKRGGAAGGRTRTRSAARAASGRAEREAQARDVPVRDAPVRDATPAEMRALGNPLRLRILRLCLDRALTNQELARLLHRDPGTVLFHVRALVAEGFLAAEPERRGPRGRTERPYLATRKSWAIRLAPSAGHTAATLEAVRHEVVDAGQDSVLATIRLGVRLGAADLAELRSRLGALGDEFAARDEPDGTPVGLLLTLHRRRDAEGRD